MIINNFKPVGKYPQCEDETDDDTYHATVDITIGNLWWKKTTTTNITKLTKGYWFFNNTGQYPPDDEIEGLEARNRGIYSINNRKQIASNNLEKLKIELDNNE